MLDCVTEKKPENWVEAVFDLLWRLLSSSNDSFFSGV